MAKSCASTRSEGLLLGKTQYRAFHAAGLFGAALLVACGTTPPPDVSGGGGVTSPQAGSAGFASEAGAATMGGATGMGGVDGLAGVAGMGGAIAGGGASMAGDGAGGMATAGGGGAGGMSPAGGGAGGAAAGMGTGGVAGAGGAGGGAVEAPAMLSETGLFTERPAGGELVLGEGVREFEPRYWLWSDGADKKRYVYLPPDTQIDTSDPDHWVFPAGAKFWKSFLVGDQLVETRLIERTGDGPDDFVFATYYWRTADATDAGKMSPKNLLLNAAGTTHDIPNGQMCDRCHNALEDRVLGFSAIQLNHDQPGVTLETLTTEGLLTDPISLDVAPPGDDPLTQDALGYLHANCGNCHNDSPGLTLESVPAPQMILRLSVNDLTLEDTGAYRTAINQLSTASSELSVPYRIAGGNIAESAVHFRMTQRMIEDQMPPIGTELTDDDGLSLIQSWIESLPPPPP